MRYLPSEARKEAEKAIESSKADAKYWNDMAMSLEKQTDEANGRAREAEVEAMRKVHESAWSGVKQAAEYEERIKILEELIEEERVRHDEALQTHERLAQKNVDEATDIAKQTELRYQKLLANANAYAKDSEERAEGARKRCDDEVAQAKAREETRVLEIRKWAEAKLRECEDQKAFEIQQMHDKISQRQRQMEETLYLNGRQKSEALKEAGRRTDTIETEAAEWRATMEIEFSRKEARLGEWAGKQRMQNTSMEAHHKGMLELEKGLHSKTMERTMQRVNRQIEYGDAGANGRDTPTRQLLNSIPPSPRGGGLQGLTVASPLKLAGGSLALSAT